MNMNMMMAMGGGGLGRRRRRTLPSKDAENFSTNNFSVNDPEKYSLVNLYTSIAKRKILENSICKNE